MATTTARVDVTRYFCEKTGCDDQVVYEIGHPCACPRHLRACGRHLGWAVQWEAHTCNHFGAHTVTVRVMRP